MAQIVRQLYATAAIGRVVPPLPLRDNAWTRWKACGRKALFRTQAGTLAAALHQERAGDDGLHVYRCLFGDHFHLGHAPRPQPDGEPLAAATQSTSA